MIIITGDTHGDFERVAEYCNEYETTEDDIMIILGDVGLNYHLDFSDIALKEEVSTYPITLFCIHGNHEERPSSISTYDTKLWNGGVVMYEKEYPNILFAQDGEIYDLDGMKTLVIGGAYSIDKYYRISGGLPWFDSEQPDDFTKDYVEKQLDKFNWKVDVVLTHTIPLSFEPTEAFLPNINQNNIDKSTEKWLDEIENKLDYEHWYCGHYHIDTTKGSIQIVYEDFIELE